VGKCFNREKCFLANFAFRTTLILITCTAVMCIFVALHCIIMWLYGSYSFRFPSFFCFIKVKLSVKVKLIVPLLCVCAILPAKAIPEMTYTVSGRTLNPTHSLTIWL